MNEAELTEKLQRLEETADNAERHSLALELSNTRDPRVFETVVKLIQRPGLEPIMKVEIVTPDDYVGDVLGDNARCSSRITTKGRTTEDHLTLNQRPLI